MTNLEGEAPRGHLLNQLGNDLGYLIDAKVESGSPEEIAEYFRIIKDFIEGGLDSASVDGANDTMTVDGFLPVIVPIPKFSEE